MVKIYKIYCFIQLLALISLSTNTAFAKDNEVFVKEPVFILSAVAGNGPGEFGIMKASAGQAYPMDFVVDINKNIWIMDQINRRIQKFDQKGRFILEFPNDKNPSPVELTSPYIECDLQGNIVIGPNLEGDMVVIDNRGKFINSFKLPDVSKAQIDFSINQDGKILYTRNNTNVSMDMNGTVLNKTESTGMIMGARRSPYSPYRPSISYNEDLKSHIWKVGKNKLDDKKDNVHAIDSSQLPELGTPGRIKMPLKVDTHENYFVYNPITGESPGEIISYHDKDGNLIAVLPQTSGELNGESFPYTCWTIDKEGNFYLVSYNDQQALFLNDYVQGLRLHVHHRYISLHHKEKRSCRFHLILRNHRP